MKLLRLQIENFGRLRDYRLELTDGLNRICEPNGWGKSTLAVFLKAMLYGLPASTKRSLDENERKKYTPWQGGVYGGSLEFETEKGRFRVERTFGAKEANDTFALYDLATNLESRAYDDPLGVALFGIDADGFERSTYLSERPFSGKNENGTIRSKLNNLLDDVNDIGNYDTAQAAIDKQRKFYKMTGERGAIAETEAKRDALARDLETCRETETRAEEVRKELETVRASMRGIDGRRRELRQKLAAASSVRERAALTERRQAMADEIAALQRQKAEITASLHGEIPTAETLNDARRQLDAVQTAKAAFVSASAASFEEAELRDLRAAYPDGAWSEEQLETVERQNDRLRALLAKRQAATEARDAAAADPRFAAGIPSPEELESAFRTLETATRPSAQDRSAHAPRALLTVLSILALVGGILLLVLPIGGMALRIVGGGCLLLGAVLLIIALRSGICANRKTRTQDAQREQSLAAVSQLLERYGMKEGHDLGRSLAELDLLAKQERANAEKRRKLRDEWAGYARETAELRASLSELFPDAGNETGDYRPWIAALRSDAERLMSLERAERIRSANRKQAETALHTEQEKLRPFLKRFDPDAGKTAREVLDFVGGQMIAYRAVSESLQKKEQALSEFIREKGLDKTPESGEEVGSFDLLNEEDARMQAQLDELGGKAGKLTVTLNGFARETDRIPDLEEEIAALTEKITVYRKNLKTIERTAQFLEESKTALSTRYLGGMQKSFSAYLARMTEGQAPDAVLNADFDVMAREYGQSRPSESFSRGWRDAVGFCVRLSLAGALYAEGEKPFFLLDDPFASFDEERLDAARRLLESLADEYQILYFVCHPVRS